MVTVFGSFPPPFYISRTIFSNYLHGRKSYICLPLFVSSLSLLLLLSCVHTVLVPLPLSFFSAACFPASLNVFPLPRLLSSSRLREKSSESLIVHLHNYQFHIVILPPLSILSRMLFNNAKYAHTYPKCHVSFSGLK